MEVMIAYTTATLNALAGFLATEPVIYLFAIICFVGIIKIFKTLAF